MSTILARRASGLAVLATLAALAPADAANIGASESAVASASAATESVAAECEAVAPVAARPPLIRHGVFRFTSYPAAWTAAQKNNRPILVYATSPGCAYCVKMLGDTYRAPQVKGFLNDSFETVYVDRMEQPELAAKLKVRFYPTTIVVGPNNKVIDVIEGYVDSNTFARRLQTTVAAETAATTTR